MRRIYDTSAEVLGFRRLELFMGRDVLQLKLMLHTLGYFRPEREFDLKAKNAASCPLTGDQTGLMGGTRAPSGTNL